MKPPARHWETCAAQTARTERSDGIPHRLLQAIALVESGRWNAERKATIAWPWTVTAEGRNAVTVPVAAAAATTRVSADLPTLAPGNYVLNWTAEGADGHEMTGAVRFMVH